MPNPNHTSRVVAAPTPMSLDELDGVAGGLANSDQARISDMSDAGLISQVADGAAAEGEAELPGLVDVDQLQFSHTVQSTNDAADASPADGTRVAALAGDIADGKLDGALGTFRDVLSQLDPATHAREIGQISTALLDRFADGDSGPPTAALYDLLDSPEFQPDKLSVLAATLSETEPRAGLELLNAAVEAFEAAGRAEAASGLRADFTGHLIEIMARPDNQTGVLLAEGVITTEQFGDAFVELSESGSREATLETYRQMSAWVQSGDMALYGEPAMQAARQAMVERLVADAAALPADANALADAYASQSLELDGLDVAPVVPEIFLDRATAIPGGLPAFFACVLVDTVAAGGDLSAQIAWANEALQGTFGEGAAWLMVDCLLALPASNETSGFLKEAFVTALSTDPNPTVIGRLLDEGVVTPAGMVTALMNQYDAGTDQPSTFEPLLKAIAAEAGDAKAAFSALIPNAVFAALSKEAADGTLDLTDAKLAAAMLIADNTLPISEFPDAVIANVLTRVGEALALKVNTASELTAACSVLKGLSAAGAEALGDAIMPLLRTTIGRSADVMAVIRGVADMPGMVLALMVEVKESLNTKVAAEGRMASMLAGPMASAIYSGTAVDDLVGAVLAGRLEATEADQIVADLGSGTPAGVVALRQAELAAALIEAGAPDSALLLAELRNELGVVPSPLIAAAAQVQSNLGLSQILQKLAIVADAADMDIGGVLARVYTEAGVTIDDAAAPAVAALIAKGALTADEARDVARSVFTAIETHEFAANLGYYDRSLLSKIAAELGEAKLVDATASAVGVNLETAAQINELRNEFHASVASGQIARAVIAEADMFGIKYAPQIIELITKLGETADVFTGSLFVDVLENLGNSTNTRDLSPTSQQWQYRDALRAELGRMLTGDAATQASWVAALKDAVTEGGQSPSEIMAEIERIAEHAFAREGLSRTNDHWNIQGPARQAMRAVWDGVDRLVAATGLALLADAPVSAAARDDALEWFRDQMPSGQAAILAALPAGHAESATLRGIASHGLDNFDWAAERQSVEKTITVGAYAATASQWTVFKVEQAREDLRGAVALAAMVGESQLDLIVDMAKAWGVIPGGAAEPANATLTAYLKGAIGLLSFEVITSAAGRDVLGQGLALEVKTGEASTSAVLADIAAVVGMTNLNIQQGLLPGVSTAPYFRDADQRTALQDAVSASFTDALNKLGMVNAAGEAFLARIESGDALKVVENARENAGTELNKLVAEATKLGTSVDAVLVALLERDASNYVMQAALPLLQSRIASGAIFAELAREVGEGAMTPFKAIDVLRDAAALSERSFGAMLANLLESVDTENPKIYAQLAGATPAIGGSEIARSLGTDVAAGRVDPASAASAAVVIATAMQADVAGALAMLVAGAAQSGAPVAAEAIKHLDEILDAKGVVAVASIAEALGNIRTTLANQKLSLATSDGEALSTLVELFVAGAVNRGDIGGLIDQFDGKVPDSALIDLIDKIDSLPNSTAQDELKLLVSTRLADRVASGATFSDTISALDSVYRSGQSDAAKGVAYQKILDLVEKATSVSSYASLYTEALKHQSPAAAAAAADDMVKQGAEVQHALAALTLYRTAIAAPSSSGTGFAQWVVGANDQVNRDLVLAGMQIAMGREIGPDGNLSAEASERYSKLRNELMQPELQEAENKVRAANMNANLSAAERERLIEAAAGSVAVELGRITGNVSDMVSKVANSSAASLVLTGSLSTSGAGQMISDNSATWVVMGGSLAKAFAGGPASVASSLAITAAGYLIKVEGFRDAIGPGMTMFMEVGLEALTMAKSILVEGAGAFIGHKVDAAIGAWEGANDIFNGLANGDLSSVGPAILKFADNLSALIGLFDPRSSLVALKAAVEQAVEMFNKAYNAISEGLEGLRDMETAATSKRLMGVAFL
ncbi:MAG TPA: hypothetical protein VNT30_13145 [Stellaceae bacterium]|nr:hypothetical protein [Stellaceae bacterium]